jgi:BRCT domain type II-containing protein
MPPVSFGQIVTKTLFLPILPKLWGRNTTGGTHTIAGRLCGRLACMTRAEAFEVVRRHGGTPSQAVTKQATLLIVGELGWPLLDDGRPSNKLSRAASYGIPAVSERRFLEWIGKSVPDSVQRTYSGEQIAALSKLSGETIQELAQFGLLDERGGRFGFRDLASARRWQNPHHSC